ncbi:hypothetical protein PG993_004386 [Apiospora rasikravindrae]|uniref:Uncharacterized protein n=1 Tax=Apiospora rasikravindrae TaxID=990691 RepID=A0ABR1TD73_9PEZI
MTTIAPALSRSTPCWWSVLLGRARIPAQLPTRRNRVPKRSGPQWAVERSILLAGASTCLYVYTHQPNTLGHQATNTKIGSSVTGGVGEGVSSWHHAWHGPGTDDSSLLRFRS